MDGCKFDKDYLETDEKEKNDIDNKLKNAQEQFKTYIESAREKNTDISDNQDKNNDSAGAAPTTNNQDKNNDSAGEVSKINDNIDGNNMQDEKKINDISNNKDNNDSAGAASTTNNDISDNKDKNNSSSDGTVAATRTTLSQMSRVGSQPIPRISYGRLPARYRNQHYGPNRGLNNQTNERSPGQKIRCANCPAFVLVSDYAYNVRLCHDCIDFVVRHANQNIN